MGYRKGMNPYKINGEITTIYITTKEGVQYEVLIDTEDLAKVSEMNTSWTIKYSKSKRDIYARTTRYLGKIDGKYKNESIYMHLLISGVNSKDKKYVDHINHNTLDNRKCNLRITSNDENTKNRKDKNINNKSGYRNVFWSNTENKWIVSLCKNYKRILIGKYDDAHEAGRIAKEAREKYYGEFKGIG
jgi:hypothetical protein